MKEKQDLLFRLNRMSMNGVPLTAKYTMSSPLQDIKNEFHRLKAHRDIQNSVKFQRKTMMAIVTGIEFMNTKFDPLDIKLDGWSENVHENIDEYDDIFEELHEKYKERAKMAPEMRLFISLVGSAFMFHLTQSLFRTLPGVNDLNLGHQSVPASSGRDHGGRGGGMPAGPPMGGGGGGSPLSSIFQMMGGLGGMGGMGGLGGGAGQGGPLGGLAEMMGGGAPSASRRDDVVSIHSDSSSDVEDRPSMNGPAGMDHILSSINASSRKGRMGGGGGGQAASPTFPPQQPTSSRMQSANTVARGQAPHITRPVEVASSGYRRSVKDGLRLNI